MTDYIRRLVSGQKARFKDDELQLELDLVYVTDHIVIMGYPAKGFEGYYRNRREDVKKFLDHRHGENYWIFNFCPLGENSYDASEFEGRVSRFPFPDHHAPPLAIMPLVAQEMRAWLSGSPERVAVLHCKAGKGRSGTMACTYLLSQDEDPAPPKLQRSFTAREWAKMRAEETIDALPEEQVLNKISPGSMSPTRVNPERSFTDALKGVLDLHTARRMRPPSDPLKKQKQGVSIPSQRRFLYYWALCLSHQVPPGFWSLTPQPSLCGALNSATCGARKRVRLTEIKLRLCELSTVKLGLVKAANLIIDKAKGNSPSTSAGGNHVWASLARYDDEFVDVLQGWEMYTRDKNGKLGVRRPCSDHRSLDKEGGEKECITDLFKDGRWDQHKMVRSFARLGETGEVIRTETQGIDKEERILTYTLQPLTKGRWQGIKTDIKTHSQAEPENIQTESYDLPADENQSFSDTDSRPLTPTNDAPKEPNTEAEQGIILDAEREVRIKLYMGQVFMGWAWLIPTFHMPQSSSSTQNGNGNENEQTRTTLRLTRKEIDFPIGLGTGIVDVEISMEWVAPPDQQDLVLDSTKEGLEETQTPTVGDTLTRPVWAKL
ncbi:Phosphatidylinositol 3,4,5-trisphosphate 3-phosphatase and dual-specificity protein phosphatase PTEN [Leucoagaricus sp. SymC.cos]|nr:Phosphatidylinositol 3,4,5-trisphosphate 3-phosphatase and dual-specificity protein phosphatase PTEN [Leucoagaricus sp. SymC.cos]